MEPISLGHFRVETDLPLLTTPGPEMHKKIKTNIVAETGFNVKLHSTSKLEQPTTTALHKNGRYEQVRQVSVDSILKTPLSVMHYNSTAQQTTTSEITGKV